MNKKANKSAIFCLIALVLTGCSAERVQMVEATRIVPQTVIATQIVRETVVTTQKPVGDVYRISEWDIDPAYYAGIIVLAQYYTFLGHGLYKEAYQLLSSDAKHPHSLEEYMESAKSFFKTVEIQAIHPFDY